MVVFVNGVDYTGQALRVMMQLMHTHYKKELPKPMFGWYVNNAKSMELILDEGEPKTIFKG